MILILVIFILSNITKAVSNSFPDYNGYGGCDFNPCNKEMEITTTNSQFNNITNIKAVAYFTSGDADTLSIDNLNYCSSDNGDGIFTVNGVDQYSSFGDITNGKAITTFSFKDAANNSPHNSIDGVKNRDPSGDCTNNTVSITFKKLAKDPATNLYPVYITANNDPDKSSAGLYPGIYNGFKYVLTNNGKMVGLRGSSSDSYNVSTTRVGSSAPTHADYIYPFGADCTVTSLETDYISYYDLDQDLSPGGTGAGSGAQYGKITAEIREKQKGASSYSVIKQWTPSAGNELHETVPFHAHPNAKYRLIFYNVYMDNDVQVAVPFNGIFNIVDCQEWTLHATSSVQPYAAPNDNVTWTHTVENPGIPPGTSDLFSGNIELQDPAGNKTNVASYNSAALAGHDSYIKYDTKHIPLTAKNGDQYCEDITYIPQSSSDSTTIGRSPKACVTIQTIPPPSDNYDSTVTLNDYEKSPSISPNTTVPVTFKVALKTGAPCTDGKTVTWQAEGYDVFGNSTSKTFYFTLHLHTTVTTTYIKHGGVHTVTTTSCNISGTTSYTAPIPKDDLNKLSINGSVSINGSGNVLPYTIRIISPSGYSPVSKNMTVYEVPYTRFYGNDIHATGTGSAPSGQIFFNNMNNGADNNGNSSASQYAAIAASLVKIATANFRNSPPYAANNGLAVSGQAWLNSNERIVTGLPGSSPYQFISNHSLSDTGDNYYTATGNITINSSKGVSGNGMTHKVTVNVQGSIYIDGDITTTGAAYFGGTFSDAKTPVILLIASGDIWISSSVQQIDAILIAGGTVYTCSDGFAEAKRVNDATGPGWESNCHTKLVINGAVGATNIRFARSIGTRLLASSPEDSGTAGQGNIDGSTGNINHAAEVINFPAYLYFATPYLTDTSSTGYQSLFNAAPLL